MREALLIAGHGSRDPEGIAEFLQLARLFREYRPEQQVEVAFLEFARPTIQEGIDRLVEHEVRRIIVLPGVLMAAGHAKNDMASEVQLARSRHPHIEIHMGRALDVEPKLLELCRLRYEEALADKPPIDSKQTLLLVVGRGSGDPDANGSIAKVTRFLHEGYSVGWSAYCFSGIAEPFLEEALPICEQLPFRRIVVQPYYLFTGVLLKKIAAFVESRRQARPDVDFVMTPHLQAHRLLLDTLEERAREAIDGTANMNCSLCRYRAQIIGHEHALGQPQQPHHHHVQGIHGHVHQLTGLSHRHPARSDRNHNHEEQHVWKNDLVRQLSF